MHHPSLFSPGLFSLSDHLQRLSKDGDLLEVLEGTVDFEYSATDSARAVRSQS